MDGETETAGVRRREGQMIWDPPPLTFSRLLPPFQTWKVAAQSGTSAQMRRRPHLPLTNWEMARDYASTLARPVKLKLEAGHMALMDMNAVAFKHLNSHCEKNKDSKIHNNYKTAIKLNVIEF